MTVEVITPRDEAAWHRARGQDITASVVGALFGVHDFTTIFELWAVKTGRIQRLPGETDAIRRGRLLEPVAVQIIREDHPEWRIMHNAAENTYYRDPERRIGATPDVIVECPRRGRGVVQIKSVEARTYRRKWLDDETGEPEAPLWIALQAIQEAHLTGARWAAVAPLVVSYGVELPLIEIPLDNAPGVMAAVIEKTADFWRMIEEGREPDPDFDRDGALIDQLYEIGDAGDAVDLTGHDGILDLIAERRVARETITAAEDRVAAIDAEVKSLLGEAEEGFIPGGQRITWKTHRRASPDGAPGLYRVLRYPRPRT